LKPTIVLWAVLAIAGLLGALRFSAFFFGFFTVGIFLIIYDLISKREEQPLPSPQPSPSIIPPTTTPPSQTCPNCGMVLEAGAAFCPRCGGKVRKE